jgi:hypothetical protein
VKDLKMVLTIIGSGFQTGLAGSLPPSQRRFLLAAIRSSLLDRHPELRPSADAGLGVLEMHLEPIIALAQRGVISGVSPIQLNESLDEHICPGCIYKPVSGKCEMSVGAGEPTGGCMLRRYGPTIFAAARDALLKLAGGAVAV